MEVIASKRELEELASLNKERLELIKRLQEENTAYRMAFENAQISWYTKLWNIVRSYLPF